MERNIPARTIVPDKPAQPIDCFFLRENTNFSNVPLGVLDSSLDEIERNSFESECEADIRAHRYREGVETDAVRFVRPTKRKVESEGRSSALHAVRSIRYSSRD